MSEWAAPDVSGVRIADTRVNQGGLMRCCLGSLGEWAREHGDSTVVADGTVVECKHGCGPSMVLDGFTWRWRGPSA